MKNNVFSMPPQGTHPEHGRIKGWRDLLSCIRADIARVEAEKEKVVPLERGEDGKLRPKR